MGVRGSTPYQDFVLSCTPNLSGFANPVSSTVAPYLPLPSYSFDNLARSSGQPATAGDLYTSFLASKAHTVRAILSASATMTSIRGLRASMDASQDPGRAPRRVACCTSEL